MASSGKAIEDVFERRGWLSGQAAAFRASIISEGRLRDYARDDTVYYQGDAAGGIYGVVSGGIGVVVGPPRLTPRVAHVLRAGDWFGYGPVLRGGKRSMQFIAIEQSMLLQVELLSLRSMGADGSDRALRIGAIANIGAEAGADIAAEMMIPTSAKRVAAILLRVTAAADGVASDHPDGFLLPQALLAQMANVSRNLANGVLKAFREAGWIAGRYNRIRILDVDGLAGFAYSDD